MGKITVYLLVNVMDVRFFFREKSSPTLGSMTGVGAPTSLESDDIILF